MSLAKVITIPKQRSRYEALRQDYLSGELSAKDVAAELHCSEDEALERIGITELQRTLAYTPEEIDAMYQRNENFDGKQANLDKLQLFQEIKADLTEFLHNCDDVYKLDEISPNKHEKNALLFLDLHVLSVFSKNEVAMLTAIMNKADRVIISAIKGGGIRISFGVENIWE